MTCFGLTLAIFSFHLEKLFVRFVTQLCKRALVLSTHHSPVWLDMAYATGVKNLLLTGTGVSAHLVVAAWWGGV